MSPRPQCTILLFLSCSAVPLTAVASDTPHHHRHYEKQQTSRWRSKWKSKLILPWKFDSSPNPNSKRDQRRDNRWNDSRRNDIRLYPDESHAPFLHGVASGDPTQYSVLIWTRVSEHFSEYDVRRDRSPLHRRDVGDTARDDASGVGDIARDDTSDDDASNTCPNDYWDNHEQREGQKSHQDASNDRVYPYTPQGGNARIQWSLWNPLNESQNFNIPHASGLVSSSSDCDGTITVTVTGLDPGTRYRYQFEHVASGARSMLGTTKTLPKELSKEFSKQFPISTAGPNDDDGDNHGNTSAAVRIAVVSCTSLWSGYFNFYRHMANYRANHETSNDTPTNNNSSGIDLVLHLGDYIYPEINRVEVHRVPNGICQGWTWFEPVVSQIPSSLKSDEYPLEHHESVKCGDSDQRRCQPQRKQQLHPYVQSIVEALNCSSSPPGRQELDVNFTALEAYRFIHRIYTMDPDLREARANIPFVVALDNHEQLGWASSELPLDGSRQAAMEWIPQRSKVKYGNVNNHVKDDYSHKKDRDDHVNYFYNIITNSSEKANDSTPFLNTLRTFQFGNLVQIILLDTYSYTHNRNLKLTQGELGNGQHDWLSHVLQNSTTKWKIVGSGKAFMPFVLNGAAKAACWPLGLATFIITIAMGLVWNVVNWLRTSISIHLKRLRQRPQRSINDVAINGAESKYLLETTNSSGNSYGSNASNDNLPNGKLLKSYDESNGVLSNKFPSQRNYLIKPSLAWIRIWMTLWASSVLFLYRLLDGGNDTSITATTPGIRTINPRLDTWEGQIPSMMRLFDQLENFNQTKGNLFATGDMHHGYASDVVRFDVNTRDLLGYRPESDSFQRYGVEFLPASGSRGNLDEKLNEFTSFLKPNTLLSRLLGPILNYVFAKMNPHFRYYNGQKHGYGLLTISNDKLEASFYQFPILEITNDVRIGKTLYFDYDNNRWSMS